MNGNFRKPEYVKRYEYTYFDLETPLNAIVANNARQTKDNYRFVVDNSSEANPIDWYNAYFIFRKAAAPDSKVVITKMRLWCPKIIFNGLGMKEYTEKYLKPKKWTYLREHHEISQTTATNSFFRISTGIRRPRHVLLWVVPTASYSNQEHNIFTFDTFSIGANNRYFTKAQLEVNNSIYYPQLEMTSQEESRLYRALMAFNSGYNDFLSGPLINRANFRNLFGMIYFDLRNQEEDVKDSVVALTFRYELNGGNPTNYTINALVLHEKEIELYTASGKLLIKA